MSNNNGCHSSIRNKAFLEVEINGRKQVLESNEVCLDKIKLSIFKSADCRYVYEGEIVKYTIKVCNESDVRVEEIEFKDTLANGTAYVQNSFKVDGKHEKPEIHGQTLEYKFHEMSHKADHTITFEVKVL